MKIDTLIKMANEISQFFRSTAEPEQAVRDIATHLKRFWEPRMRAEIIRYCEERNGAGLSDLALRAVKLLEKPVPEVLPPAGTASPPRSAGA